MRLANRAGYEPDDGSIVLRSSRANGPAAWEPEPVEPRRRGFGRDVLIVALIAIAVGVAYPSFEQYLPVTVRMHVASLMNSVRPPAVVATEGDAIVLREVNLRAGPSTTSKVIALLPRGSRVATAEKRGEWTFVQVEAYSRNTQLRRGWVFASFLESVEEDVAADSSEELD